MLCRKTTTTVNAHTSSKINVTHGTAQGSILGPLIFILYVNDIFKIIDQKDSIFMYADDTLLMCNADNINEATEKIKIQLEKMVTWCEENKLSINFAKTKHMIVKHAKNQTEPVVKIAGKTLSNVNQYEYLGIILDDKLTMNSYVDSMWKTANSKIGILTKIRRFVSVKTATKIYKTMIRPHLDYIDFVVDSSSTDRVKKLDSLKKKALRRIEYNMNPQDRKDYQILQDEYKIEDLRLRRKRNLVKIIHTRREKLKLPEIDSLRKTRSSTKVKINNKFKNITKVYNSPLYRGARLWEMLPDDIQKEENKYVFKKRVKNFIF